MTKSAARRAIAGGCNARAFSYAAPAKNSINQEKLGTSGLANRGAFHYAQRNCDFDDLQHGSGGRTPRREPPMVTGIPIDQPHRQGRNAVLHPTRQPQKIH